MVNEILQKSKRVYKGNAVLFSLYLSVCIMLVLSVNLLPLVYQKSVDFFSGNGLWKYSEQLNFFVSVILFLFSVFIFYCLSSSVTRCFMKRARGKQVSIDDVFYFFTPVKAMENFGLRIGLSFIRRLLLLFFLLPFILCAVVLYLLSVSSVSVSVYAIAAVGCILLFAVGIVFYLRFSSLLFLCPYLICSDEKTSLKKAVGTSVKIMKDKKGELAKIRLKFAGYFLLCVLVFPVGYVWGRYRQTVSCAAIVFLKQLN